MDIAYALYEIARDNGGLVTREDAEMIGVADQRLTDLVRNGVIARVARGVYSIGTPANPGRPARRDQGMQRRAQS